MNREQQIAVVMVILLQNPQVGRDNTLDGVANHVFSSGILRDRYFDEYDRPARWNECYAVAKEADERLRQGKTSYEFYGELLEGRAEIATELAKRWNSESKIESLTAEQKAVSEGQRIKSAIELTDEEIVAELAIINDRIDTGFGDGGGSPGEWWYERADELDAEQKRRATFPRCSSPFAS